MNSPWFGLLFLHGHITDRNLAKRLTDTSPASGGLIDAIKRLKKTSTAPFHKSAAPNAGEGPDTCAKKSWPRLSVPR